ncbi:hypothetical protein HDU81_006223 [Chytriomyces hyalinus]|nr:hypothetical protein HDU81_006223 [Chytriomyces hyalinus]
MLTLTWSVIPYEIKELILRRLSFARDILNAGLTSKDAYAILTDDVFWRHNCLPPEDASAKEAFSTLALRSLQAQSKHMTGAWTNNIQYWKPCTLQHSISEQVLALNSVWWFDVNASFNVPSGRYRPYFRVAYDLRHYTENFRALNLENLKFQVQLIDNETNDATFEHSATLTQFDELHSLPRCTWVRLFLPEITISPLHAFKQVYCSITDTATTLKRHFCVDVIGLERVLGYVVEVGRGDSDAVFVKVEEEFHPV